MAIAVFAALCSLWARAGTTQAATGINKQINFQGKLVNANGTNVANGNYNMEFKLYDAASGGTTLWTETRLNNNSQGVAVTDGVFQVNLGSITSLPGSVDFNTDNIYLGINVGSTNGTCTPFSNCSPDGEMTPRIRFTAAPYAFNADALDGLSAGNFVQLAQGVQTDASTTNPSIYINKIGTTANIIEIEKSGSDVLVINNAGETTFGGAVDIDNIAAVGNAASTSVSIGLNVVHDQAGNGGTNCVFGCYGIVGTATTNSTTNIIAGARFAADVQNSSFTVSSTAAIIASTTTKGASATITNNYGLYVYSQTAGTNDYGIYVGGADTNAIWVDGGTSRFDGAINIVPESTGTYLDVALETEWTSGTLINVDYASSSAQTGDITGFNLNFNTNLTGQDDHDVTGVRVETPGFTGDATATTTHKGLYVTGGAFDSSGAGATSINWYGLDIQVPSLDTGHADDTVSATGLRILVPTITDGAGTESINQIVWGLGSDNTAALRQVSFLVDITQLETDHDGDGIALLQIINGQDEVLQYANDAFTIPDGVELNIHSPATANTTALCWDNSGASNVTDCNGSATDLAENFGSTEAGIEAGDLVAFDPNREAQEVNIKDDYDQDNKTTKAWVVKTKKANDDNLIGVVSTNPNQLFGDDGVFTENENPVPVTLVGRVPVKVNSENGPIKPGDYITASSTPGVGMKATASSKVIGVALASWTDKDPKKNGKIVVFVNPTHYSNPGSDARNGAGRSLVSTGSFTNNTTMLLMTAAVSISGLVGNWLFSRRKRTSYYSL